VLTLLIAFALEASRLVEDIKTLVLASQVDATCDVDIQSVICCRDPFGESGDHSWVKSLPLFLRAFIGVDVVYYSRGLGHVNFKKFHDSWRPFLSLRRPVYVTGDAELRQFVNEDWATSMVTNLEYRVKDRPLWESVAHLRRLSQLQRLTIRGAGRLTARDGEAIASLEGLETIQVSDCGILDERFCSALGLSRVHTLMFDFLTVHKLHVELLAKSGHEIWLWNCVIPEGHHAPSRGLAFRLVARDQRILWEEARYPGESRTNGPTYRFLIHACLCAGERIREVIGSRQLSLSQCD
jgi:hypothetical protein